MNNLRICIEIYFLSIKQTSRDAPWLLMNICFNMFVCWKTIKNGSRTILKIELLPDSFKRCSSTREFPFGTPSPRYFLKMHLNRKYCETFDHTSYHRNWVRIEQTFPFRYIEYSTANYGDQSTYSSTKPFNTKYSNWRGE